MKWMIKIFMIGGALFLHGSLKAHTHFQGVSVGIRGGMTNPTSEVKRKYLIGNSRSDRFSLMETATGGGLDLTYGYLKNWLYVGVQGYADRFNAKTTYTNRALGCFFSDHLTVKHKGSYGAHLRVGRAFNNTLVYLKGGVSFTKIEVESFMKLQIGPSYKRKSYRAAGESGIGTEVAVAKRFSVGAEYTYKMYDKINFKHGNASRVSIQPRSHTFLVILRYSLL